MKYGWKKQAPDPRDWKFTAKIPKAKLPKAVDLRATCPPIYDQGDIGSCTANATCGAMRQLMMSEKVAVLDLSRLDLYYNERVIEGTVAEDSGATLRDSMKAAVNGTCLENFWPYGDGSTFTTPPPAALTDAPNHKLKSYLAVNGLTGLEQALAQGYPVVFGIAVYSSFESDAVAKTGVVPLPRVGEQMLGGHAIRAVGYDTKSKRVIFANSWGVGWGDKGYGYLPFNYVSSTVLAADFWTPRLF